MYKTVEYRQGQPPRVKEEGDLKKCNKMRDKLRGSYAQGKHCGRARGHGAVRVEVCVERVDT